MSLLTVVWDASPVLFEVGPIQVRYYGLFFAIGFILGYNLLERMFKNDKAPDSWIESIFFYIIIATVVGARLGHVFFYGWDYYKDHLLEIFAVWHGGLASHGGAIGILIAVWLFAKNVTKGTMLWVLDRLVIVVALAAVLIRLGNFMNSEIVGKVTDLPWGVIFSKASDINSPELPHHPSQLYEAFVYLTTFLVTFYMYWKTKAKKYEGLIFGVALLGIFLTRFFMEFIKEPQEGWEADMTLNMGQILSIPFVVLAFYFIYRAYQKWKSEIVK